MSKILLIDVLLPILRWCCLQTWSADKIFKNIFCKIFVVLNWGIILGAKFVNIVIKSVNQISKKNWFKFTNFSDIKGFCLYKSREDRLVSYLGPIPYSSQAKPVVSRKVLTTNDYHLELFLVITLKFVLFLFWPLSAPPFKAIAPIFLKVPQNFFIWCIFALGGCQLSIYAFRLLCFGGFKITL